VELEDEAQPGGTYPGELAPIQMIDPPPGDLGGSGIGVVQCSENVQ